MRSEVYFYGDEKDIPEGYRYDCENDEVYEYRNPYNGKVIHIAKNPPMYVKAIPIPDNATNGDVIKALFPNDAIHQVCKDTVNFSFIQAESSIKVYKSWWNAPYKRGDEDRGWWGDKYANNN